MLGEIPELERQERRNVIPSNAVDASQIRNPLRFPLVRLDYARTMLIELIKSTNVITEVTGMLNTSSGSGPAMLLSL